MAQITFADIISTKNSKSPGKSGKSGPDQILTNTIKNPLSIEIFYSRFKSQLKLNHASIAAQIQARTTSRTQRIRRSRTEGSTKP
jgi:hypothetical protein